ncbi:MAG: metallophosphoesterase [Mangrovibacterium sp.]
MYDIIGDVHGEADKLVKLLLKMGYEQKHGFFQHAQRKVIFVGDFINRGPQIKKTIEIIRAMEERGSAYVILGNHELYALLYCLRDKLGKRLSDKPDQHRLSLESTLQEFSTNKKEWKSHLEWLRTLPFFLDLGDIRVVHAAWNQEAVDFLKETASDNHLSRKKLKELGSGNTPEGALFWELCRGVDFVLPKDLLLKDSKGDSHSYFRRKWWLSGEGETFRSLSYDFRYQVPDYQIPRELVQLRVPYPADAPIVFFGHYCIQKSLNIISSNLCCLDSCVRRTGKLIAYRWSGEKVLEKSHLFS